MINGLRLQHGDKIFFGDEANGCTQEQVFACAVFNKNEEHYVRRFGVDKEQVAAAVLQEPEFVRRRMHVLVRQFSEWVSEVLHASHNEPQMFHRLSGKSVDRFTHEVGRTWRKVGQQVDAERLKLYGTLERPKPRKKS